MKGKKGEEEEKNGEAGANIGSDVVKIMRPYF